MYERSKPKEDQIMSSFFDILPQDFNEFPIFFTDEELLYLSGSPTLTVINEFKKDLLNDFNKICEMVP